MDRNRSNVQKFVSPRRIALILLALLVIASIILSIFETRNNVLGLSGKMVIHTNIVARYSIMLPPKWYVDDLENGNHGDMDIKSVIESPYSSVHIEIATKELPSPVDIENVTIWGETKKNLEKGYLKIISHSYATPTYSGVLEEYSKTIFGIPTQLFWNNKTYHCLSFYTLRENEGYDFSFCSVESSWSVARPLFIEEINSIQLLN